MNNFFFVTDKDFLDEQKKNLRVAAGLGFVLKLGTMARVELNYVHPLQMVDTDNAVKGIQIGIGVDFL